MSTLTGRCCAAIATMHAQCMHCSNRWNASSRAAASGTAAANMANCMGPATQGRKADSTCDPHFDSFFQTSLSPPPPAPTGAYDMLSNCPQPCHVSRARPTPAPQLLLLYLVNQAAGTPVARARQPWPARLPRGAARPPRRTCAGAPLPGSSHRAQAPLAGCGRGPEEQARALA
jgi:hypothetical protein